MQYIVNESNIDKRKEFYNYIMNNYKIKNMDYKDNMINNKYPFVVDFDEKIFWICNSITCLACASQNKQIISIEEFKKRIKQ